MTLQFMFCNTIVRVFHKVVTFFRKNAHAALLYREKEQITCNESVDRARRLKDNESPVTGSYICIGQNEVRVQIH